MASRTSVSRNLHSILPALSSALPEALVDLANSLYAQSRAKASTLKPEEEVAREHICCVIAAERLKQVLNLPAIEPRPPCPPRLYKRLYKYIDASVPPVAQGSSTPRKSALIAKFDANPASARNASSASGSLLKRNASVHSDVLKDVHVPDWVDHAIGYVTRNLARPAAAPYIKIAIGALYRNLLESTSDTPVKRPRSDGKALSGRTFVNETQLPPLIVAITILVLQRLTGHDAGFSENSVAKAAAQDMMALKRIGITRVGTCVNEAIELLEDSADHWRKTEWYLKIPAPDISEEIAIDPRLCHPHPSQGEDTAQYTENSVNGLPPDSIEERNAPEQPQAEGHQSSYNTGSHDSDSAAKEYSNGKLEQPQLEEGFRRIMCPMMQDKTDWLSAGRRADFAGWKALTLSKITQIEAEHMRGAKTKRPVRVASGP